MSELQVLVVDDSREIRNFVVECVLKPQGYTGFEATNGAEGVRVALKGGFDLVLLDYEMPKMNGIEVLEALSERCADIPVILMTSHGSESVAVEVFRKGVREYVIKPFTAGEMLAAIERSMREVRLQREKRALTNRLMQANRQLEQRLRELNTLYKIGKSVTSLMTRDKLLERIVDAALYITGAEQGAIFLENNLDGGLRECIRKSRAVGQEQQLSNRSETQLAMDAIQKGDATISGAILYAPLKIGHSPIGALGVSNKVTARFFNKHDQHLLMALADYAAIAIENTRLLKQVEQAKDREKQQIRGLFERYVAPNVVEQLVAQPEAVALGGIQQHVTTLFADIRGFSSFSTRVTPEQLVDVLNYHIAVAAEAILAEGGTLDKFLGDAVMAYFNAPLPQPDHALRAVRAAWRISHAVEASHATLQPGYQLQFGIGVSTGEALVGNIGAPQLMSFTVIGDTVNMSRRLQEHARGGQILISQALYEEVLGFVRARPVGKLKLKGHIEPEPVFEVVAVKM